MFTDKAKQAQKVASSCTKGRLFELGCSWSSGRVFERGIGEGGVWGFGHMWGGRQRGVTHLGCNWDKHRGVLKGAEGGLGAAQPT